MEIHSSISIPSSFKRTYHRGKYNYDLNGEVKDKLKYYLKQIIQERQPDNNANVKLDYNIFERNVKQNNIP